MDQSKNMIIKTRTNKSSRSRWLTCAQCKRIRDSWLVKKVLGIIFNQSQSRRTNWGGISSQEINNLWKWKKTMFVLVTEQPFLCFQKSLWFLCLLCHFFLFHRVDEVTIPEFLSGMQDLVSSNLNLLSEEDDKKKKEGKHTRGIKGEGKEQRKHLC